LRTGPGYETFDILAKTILTVVNAFARFGFRVLAQVTGAIVAAGAMPSAVSTCWVCIAPPGATAKSG
jgi:hypothetical protein